MGSRDHLASHLRRRELERHVAMIVARALLESPDRVHPRVGERSTLHDKRTLRGIPVVGGTSGHIPGTRPDLLH